MAAKLPMRVPLEKENDSPGSGSSMVLPKGTSQGLVHHLKNQGFGGA